MSRINKLFNSKKPQLRRCAFCDKPGHNRSTCEAYLSSLVNVEQHAAPTGPAPIKFFVHHVAHQPTASEHVVNLKQDVTPAWHKVAAVEPTKNPSYDFSAAYEKIKQEINSARKIQPSDINQNIFTKIPSLSPAELRTQKETPSFAPTKDKKKRNFLLPIISYWVNFRNRIHKFIKENFVWRRMASATALLLLILIVPSSASSYFADVKLTKDKIASDSTVGFMSLQNSTAALMQSNLPVAEDAINNALNSFGAAVETMNTNHQLLQKIASIIPILSDEVKSRQALLVSGQKIALGNTYLLKGIADSQTDASSTLDKRLDTIMIHLNSAIPNYKDAMNQINTVDINSLPLNYQGPFIEFKKIFGAVLSDLTNLRDLGGSIKEIFGVEGQRRYLLVFQNPDELRPTGGFLGSMAIMDIKNGKIIDLTVPPGGSYDLQGQLDQYLVPPTPLLLTNKRWEFQDSNWFPDFRVSAQKMMWFYRHSRNVSVDGVIAINASVMERLLAITGPMIDDKRGLTITANNAIATIQQVVETGPEKKANKPKQILSDLAPQFISHFENSQPKDLLPLLVSLQDALNKKEIQAYFSDADAQTAIEQLGWSGKIIKTNFNQDYLAIFNTNIHGQKSDARMKQIISHQTEIQNNGDIIDNVTITRIHNGNAEENLYGAANIDYIRVYVPKGSELISANGFVWPQESDFRAPDNWSKTDDLLNQTEKEIRIDDRTGTRITEEFDKTAFGNWIITTPGQTNKIEFIYKLPFKISDISSHETSSWKKLIGSKDAARFQFVVQKQSGIESSFESQIIFPSEWTPNYKNGDEFELALNGGSISPQILDTDKIWGLVMEK